MIKLTINSETHSTIKFFQKKSIVIGSGVEADINLIEESLFPVHLKIIQERNHAMIINQANDPFVALNNLPFGRKILKNKDLIQIGETTILCEFVDLQAQEAHLVTSKSNLLENPTHLGEKEVSSNEKENSNEALLSENFAKREELNSSRQQNGFHIGDFDDENENWVQEKHEFLLPPSSSELRSYHLKFWLTIVAIAFIASFVVVAAFYMSISDKSEEQELIAAEGITDVAMALKYAQIYHVKPLKQNWSDPEFIKNSLANILTPHYPSLAKIDSHGQFSNTPYILRIYTSADFSHFLVIAQPAPSVFHWLVPKNSIVIDSRIMEMRKISDLKAFNRLLASTSVLDETNASEILKLVNEGELIPLASLTNEHNHLEFSPPKALALIRPGAENFIYNAPRYYHLGETIMKKAVNLTDDTSINLEEFDRLKQEVNILSEMSDIVFYSSEGMQFAMKAHQALSSLFPEIKPLTAYLTFNSNDIMTGARLVTLEQHTPLAMQEEAQILLKREELPKTTEQHPVLPIKVSSLAKELSKISRSRKNALESSNEKIRQFLDCHLVQPQSHFPQQFEEVLQTCKKIENEQHEIILQRIAHLYYKHVDSPFIEFKRLAKEAGLELYFSEFLQDQLSFLELNYLIFHEVEDLLQLNVYQEPSQKFAFFDSHKSSSLQEKFDRLKLLMSLQKLLRPNIAEKIDQFIFGLNEQHSWRKSNNGQTSETSFATESGFIPLYE